jgi:capsular polysaccharide biosynthesis protein
MAELNRNYQVSQEHYRSLLDKTFSANMAADLERRQQGERFKILDSAQVPERPVKPKRKLLFPVAVIVGFALAIAMSLALQFTRGGIRTEHQLKALLPRDIPVLTHVPVIVTSAQRRWRVRLAMVSSVACMLIMTAEVALLFKIKPIV